jgi:predicted HD superfamily hydrolase involved in NAD metabolism
MIKDMVITDLELIYQHKPHRLKHVYGVRDQAIKLGLKYNLDLNKLELASLLHDITKYYSLERNVEIIKNHYPNYNEILQEFNEHILHAFSARVVAQKKYFVQDEDILNAIEHHTVGKPNMSMYEKVLFISDYTEINRTYDSCVRVRNILEDDIDKAVYTAISDSIIFYENVGDVIPKTAYQALAFYKKLLEERNG